MTDLRPSLRGRLLVARADASAATGTGHMMRVLALVQAWLDRGGRARWLVATAPDLLVAQIEREGVAIDRLRVPSGSVEDASVFRRTLNRGPSALAVVDGAAFGDRYLETIRDVGRRVLLIDDMAQLPAYPVGYVLNQNAHADRAEYPAGSSCRFLLGTRYVLLRREFVPDPPPRTIPATARHVLVTFGGADPTGMTTRTIRALQRLPAALRSGVSVRIIVGAANVDGHRLEAQVAAPDLGFQASLERGVTDMAAQMAWADLAITSGGSAVWELARMGCPALVVETVPAEKKLVAGLARIGVFGHLGPASDLDGQAMAHEIAAEIRDFGWRTEMAALGMRLVDGQGARRVLEVMTDGEMPRGE